MATTSRTARYQVDGGEETNQQQSAHDDEVREGLLEREPNEDLGDGERDREGEGKQSDGRSRAAPRGVTRRKCAELFQSPPGQGPHGPIHHGLLTRARRCVVGPLANHSTPYAPEQDPEIELDVHRRR